jgi:membrane protein DedA with SNARE-associated domain
VGESLDFLIRHGSTVLFLVVLGEQLGLPLVGAPVLLAAGALGAMGRLAASNALLLTVLACLIADLAWYEVGRRRGASVLTWLCRIALEPDSCVRRTENVFARYGARALLVAKFVPGLNSIAAPLAGVVGMGAARFLAWDTGGALLWGGTYIGLGYFFSAQLEWIALSIGRLGTAGSALLGAALAAYVAWKYVHRRRFLRSLRIARIAPEDLQRRLAQGEPVLVVDLRGPLSAGADAMKLPGALRLSPEELERRHGEIPRDREVVVYCS